MLVLKPSWCGGAGGAARGRAGAGVRVTQAGPGALRGCGYPLPYPRVLDLPVPRREALPIRLRQVCSQVVQLRNNTKFAKMHESRAISSDFFLC